MRRHVAILGSSLKGKNNDLLNELCNCDTDIIFLSYRLFTELKLISLNILPRLVSSVTSLRPDQTIVS